MQNKGFLSAGLLQRLDFFADVAYKVQIEIFQHGSDEHEHHVLCQKRKRQVCPSEIVVLYVEVLFTLSTRIVEHYNVPLRRYPVVGENAAVSVHFPEHVDGKNVIVINVPRATYTERPVYINNNLAKGTFKRNHEGDYHCTEQELKMMLRDANEAGNDGMLLEYYTMDDIDVPTLERYRKMFQTLHPEHQWNSSDDKEFLMNFGGYAKDRRTGEEGLTMAGLLMFGKGLPVRERFDNLRMDYIDKSNLIGDQRYSDRLTYDGTWENNLFNFIRMVIPKLTRDLPRPFSMDGVIRTDDTLQAKAIREAVTNMIIHSDFMLNGVLKVEKYDDCFVLTNPGLLKLPIEQIYRGGESKARNQRMQNMFRMIGYGENLGSGFPLILNAWNEKHWLKPELMEQPELMQVKLTLHIQNEPITEPINVSLTERQKAILSLLKQNPSYSRDELAEKTGLSLATIKREITILRKNGYIGRDGSNKNGQWLILKMF